MAVTNVAQELTSKEVLRNPISVIDEFRYLKSNIFRIGICDMEIRISLFDPFSLSESHLHRSLYLSR